MPIKVFSVYADPADDEEGYPPTLGVHLHPSEVSEYFRQYMLMMCPYPDQPTRCYIDYGSYIDQSGYHDWAYFRDFAISEDRHTLTLTTSDRPHGRCSDTVFVSDTPVPEGCEAVLEVMKAGSWMP